MHYKVISDCRALKLSYCNRVSFFVCACWLITAISMSVFHDPSISISSSRQQRVAIIGAGAAGLIAAHCVHKLCTDAEITVFERSSGVGGVWGAHNAGTSPMYKSLRTNLPKVRN